MAGPGVDTVFVSQYIGEDAFDILRRVRHMNPDINILGDFSFDYTDFLLADADVSDDIYIATPIPLEPSEKVDDFYTVTGKVWHRAHTMGHSAV